VLDYHFNFSYIWRHFDRLWSGLILSLELALVSILIGMVIGLALALVYTGGGRASRTLVAAYVEFIRNVPLLVQLFFWYVLISENLPGPNEALSPINGIFLSNRGIAFPIPLPDSVYPWLGVALAAGIGLAWMLARWGRRRQALTGTPFPAFRAGAALVFGLPLALFLGAGAPLELDYPVLSGFNFTGGGALSPEFAALLVGLVIYTAAFIAEIVRAGVLAVDRGQFEAAHSLGLKRRETMRLVILPQALRLIVPPMTSQYLNLTKNSSLAVAIGYPELVSIANTTINQTGQAIEGIAIIMLVYLTISLSISAFMNWYNRRMALRGAKT
jgi:general L-amino acid transport system permease protein